MISRRQQMWQNHPINQADINVSNIWHGIFINIKANKTNYPQGGNRS
jgi:hypothetical protein